MQTKFSGSCSLSALGPSRPGVDEYRLQESVNVGRISAKMYDASGVNLTPRRIPRGCKKIFLRVLGES
jgi:hypothetical protein